MSERKTAEIKFRVTPTEKAAWQRYAERAGLGLSELIRREVNWGIRASEARQAEALPAAPDPIEVPLVQMPDADHPAVPHVDRTCTGPEGCSSCPDPEHCVALRVELWEQQNAKIDGTSLVGNAIALLEPTGHEKFEFPSVPPWAFEARNG